MTRDPWLAGNDVRRLGAAAPRASAAQTAYDWLKNRIAGIPRDVGLFISEMDVSEGSGTGRTPAREALQRLQSEGYLQILPRKGIYIPAISDHDVIAAMDARRVVEDWSVGIVARAGTLADSTLFDLIDEQHASVGQDQRFIELDRLFHGTIVQRTDNTIISAFYEQLRDRQVRMGITAITGERDRDLRVLDEHREIADAIRSGDADRATMLMETHLDTTLGAILKQR